MATASYGNWVFQTDQEPEDVLRQVLADNAEGTLKELGQEQAAGDVVYQFNKPYEMDDPETGERISGFASSWKVTLDAH